MKSGIAKDIAGREFYASSDLIEALNKVAKSEYTIVNFAYTDYGGDFFERVCIQYFKTNYPDQIVFEPTNWYGENAVIWGELAKRFIEETQNYPLGFESMESLYSEMECNSEDKSFQYFIENATDENTSFRKNALEKLQNERGGYYSVMSSGDLDFCSGDLLKFCLENGIAMKHKSRGHLIAL